MTPQRNDVRNFLIVGIAVIVVQTLALVGVYLLGRQSVRDEVGDRVAAVQKGEQRSRLRACEDANNRDQARLQVFLPLVVSPRGQEALQQAYAPRDCNALVSGATGPKRGA